MTTRSLRRLTAAGAMALAMALVAAPVFAAANPQEAAETAAGWIYRWINFLIFVGFLVWAFTKKTPPYFRSRQKAIAGAIAESARAREDAQREERAAEQKMASLEGQIADLRSRASQDSAAEAERIRALAREEVGRIEQAGQTEIRAAERAAEAELKAMAARLAVERAEALLISQINSEAEARLFEGFVASLEGARN